MNIPDRVVVENALKLYERIAEAINVEACEANIEGRPPVCWEAVGLALHWATTKAEQCDEGL